MKRVRNTENRVVTIPVGRDNVRIMPGNNELDDRTFDTLMKQSGFKKKLESGKFVIPSSPDKKVGESETRLALRTVEETNDLDTLKQMREEAKGKPKVIAAIDERIKLVAGENKGDAGNG